MNSPEIKMVPKIVALNDFIEYEIPSIKAKISMIPDEAECDWKKLDEVFLKAIEKYLN